MKAAIREILLVAQGIEDSFGDDKDAAKWVRRLRKAAAKLAK